MGKDETIAQNFIRQVRALSDRVAPEDLKGYIVIAASTGGNISILATGPAALLRDAYDSADAAVENLEAEEALLAECDRLHEEEWHKALDEVPTARLEAALARRQAQEEASASRMTSIESLAKRFGLKVIDFNLDCNDPLCPVHGVGGAGA